MANGRKTIAAAAGIFSAMILLTGGALFTLWRAQNGQDAGSSATAARVQTAEQTQQAAPAETALTSASEASDPSGQTETETAAKPAPGTTSSAEPETTERRTETVQQTQEQTSPQTQEQTSPQTPAEAGQSIRLPDGMTFGIDEKTVQASLRQRYPGIGEIDCLEDYTGAPENVCYIPAADSRSEMPESRTAVFSAETGGLVQYGIVYGAERSRSGESYPVPEQTLRSTYRSLLDGLTGMLGAPDETGSDVQGVIGQAVWRRGGTEVWLCFGMDLWFEGSGVNSVALYYTDISPAPAG